MHRILLAALAAIGITWMAAAPVIAEPQKKGGPVAKGPVVKGPVVKGPVVKGPVVKGPVVKGPVVKGPVVKGPAVKGPVVKGTVVKGAVVKGPVIKGGKGVTVIGGRSVTIVTGPRTIYWGGRARRVVAISALPIALGIIAISGRRYYAHGYPAIAATPNVCYGLTEDGCELRLQEVPLEDGGAGLICVQYCPWEPY